MKKLFAILISLILCMGTLSAVAVDAVSSATVSIESFPELKEHENAKTLVIYFSTDDTVKAVALTAADALEAERMASYATDGQIRTWALSALEEAAK